MRNHANPNAKRVLLVDDEDRLRGILARYLRARGHHVIEARMASEACGALEQEMVDVLLLDVNLLDDTGWDVMRWIEAHDERAAGWDRPRIVILSAVPPSPKRLEQFAPDAILNKPFPIDALGRLVDTDCQPAFIESGYD
jgi:DNA-binding response OmpR family regulator